MTGKDRSWYNHDRLKEIEKINQKEYQRRKSVRFKIPALEATRADLAKFRKFAKNNEMELRNIISTNPLLTELRWS